MTEAISTSRRKLLLGLFGIAGAAVCLGTIGTGTAEAATPAPAPAPEPPVEEAKTEMAPDDALPESVETQYYYRRRVYRPRRRVYVVRRRRPVYRVYRRPVYRRRVYRRVYW